MSDVPILDAATYRRWCAYLEEATGIVLGDGKDYMITTRLAGLRERTGAADFAALLELVAAAGDRYRQEVVDALTTNETTWFRDRAPFTALRDHVLPGIGRQFAAGDRHNLRVWCAACSSGQEPYSLAMTVLEHAEAHPGFPLDRVAILATDISRRALAQARTGVYGSLEMSRGLTPTHRERFFDRVGDRWAIRPAVRKLVTYRSFNLLDDPAPLGSFDLIFCRYVAIYFDPEAKARLLRRLRGVLRPGGLLFLGATESLPRHRELALTPVRLAGATCYRAEGADRPPHDERTNRGTSDRPREGKPTDGGTADDPMDPARIAAEMDRIRELLRG